jgi:hypothetical protein
MLLHKLVQQYKTWESLFQRKCLTNHHHMKRRRLLVEHLKRLLVEALPINYRHHHMCHKVLSQKYAKGLKCSNNS